jgi:hypothetical protein
MYILHWWLCSELESYLTTRSGIVYYESRIYGALWLKCLFGELSLYKGITIIYCDSQSAIHLTRDQRYYGRMKHIDVKFHFIRDIIDEERVLVQKFNTKDNPVDMLTKPLPVYKFK